MASNRPSLARNRVQAGHDVSAEQARSELQRTIQSRSDLMTSVRQLLDNEGISENGRKEVFDFCIDQLNSDTLTNHVAKELVGKLLVEIEKLSGHCLVGVAELLIEGVKLGKIANGRSIELFPRILSVVGHQASIRMDRAAAGAATMTMTGLDCKSHLINSLFGCRWAPSSVSHIANISRDITLTEDELKMLIDKLLRVMRTLSPQELPPLVYQLMVLSHKGHHSSVMTGIRDLFTYLEEIVLNREENDVQEISCSSKELLQTEGTVLHHISHAIKHNHELTKEYLKGLKVTQSQLKQSTLTPFTMALALSLIRVHKFEDAVMDFVKNVALKCFKDEARRKSSSIMQGLAQLRSTPNIEKVMFDTVEHSIHGWDSVVSGLVMVGFHLLDSFSPKTTGVAALGTPQMKACLLGGRVLYRCVKHHQSIRQGVLYELVNRILTSASVCAYHYIGLLEDITSAFPHESVPKLSETFGFLNSLPSAPAVAFLKAVLPLLTASAALRDSLLIVLRKLLFSKHIECRKTAVGGYLLLLRKFKVLQPRAEDDSQNSQYSQSQSPRVLQTQAELHVFGSGSSRFGNEALCLEIVGALRRCLGQQDEVRMTLYEGLYSVFCSNTKMAEPILGLLISQFDQYYEIESYVTPPIKLASCMLTSGGVTTRKEPLANLLNCLQLCIARQRLLEEGGAEPLPQIQHTSETLKALADRMSNCEMEDFELDKSGDYSSSTSVGSKNSITARTIIGLYETLMDYVFTSGEYSLESCQLVLKLFRCYQTLHELLQDKGSGPGRRGSTSKYSSGKNSCVISLPSVVNLLHAVFSDNKPSHQQPLAVFRESTSFVKYVLTCVHAKIQLLSDGDIEGAGWLYQWTDSGGQSRKSEKSFKECCSIGKTLYTQISTAACNREAGKKEKGKPVHLMCLDSFHQLVVKVVLVHHSSRLSEFLAAITAGGDRRDDEEEGEEREESTTCDERLMLVIQHFQKLALSVFNGTSNDYSMKDVQIIVALLSALSDYLDEESEHVKEVFEWTKSQCREFNISDIPVCKAMLSLLFQLGGRQSTNLKIISKVSQAIHYHVGDIEETVEFGEQEMFYAIVSPQTANALLPMLYSQIEQILENCAIIVSFLTTELASQDDDSDDDDSSGEKLFTLVADCLMPIVLSCHELVQTKPSNTIDGILKVLIKLYETLGDFAKYSLSLYTHQVTVHKNFKKLCDKVGKYLCHQIYSCIQCSQSMSDTGRPGAKGKGKGKGKGKAPSAGKVVVRKETKLIPKLIYGLEQFEKYILQLSKKSKINLLENFPRSTSRDFRIFNSKLEDIMNEEEEDEDDEKMDVGEEEEDVSVQSDHSSSTSAPPKTKRLKRQ